MRAVLPVLLLVLLAACGRTEIYQSDVPIPAGGWASSNKPSFCFDITDTVSAHDVFIDVRHTGDYPYNDLYLFVDLEAPSGRTWRDTVECRLADELGQWYGRGTGYIFADRFEAHILYRLGDRFPWAGRYCMRLEQAMRHDTLPGVLDVGISIEPSRSGR